MKSIAFICVNYNNSFHTINWIDSILKIINDSDSLIIVDCASNIEDKKNIAKKLSTLNNIENIQFIESKENIGYFRGLNLGIKKLNIEKYEFIIVGNNDLLFDAEFKLKLFEIELDHNTFVLAPKIVNLDGLNQNPHVETHFSLSRNLYYELLFFNKYTFNILSSLSLLIKKKSKKNKTNEKERYIFMGYGACYILTRSYLNKFKYLPDDLFLMGEEPLLSNQVFTIGGKILYCPSLKVNHIEHASVRNLNSTYKFNLLKTSYIYHKKNSLFLNYFRK